MAHQANDAFADPELGVLRGYGDDHVPPVQAASLGGERLRENDVAGLIERRYHRRPGALQEKNARRETRCSVHARVVGKGSLNGEKGERACVTRSALYCCFLSGAVRNYNAARPQMDAELLLLFLCFGSWLAALQNTMQPRVNLHRMYGKPWVKITKYPQMHRGRWGVSKMYERSQRKGVKHGLRGMLVDTRTASSIPVDNNSGGARENDAPTPHPRDSNQLHAQYHPPSLFTTMPQAMLLVQTAELKNCYLVRRRQVVTWSPTRHMT